jgi:hypothetical protein
VIAFCISAMATPAEHERVVRQFVTDFSAGAIDKMLDAVSDQVELMSVDGAKANLDLTGKRALCEYLTRDFARIRELDSSLEWLRSTGQRVAVQETVSWRGKNGTQRQSSLAVYELENAKIGRVWYDPAERAAP